MISKIRSLWSGGGTPSPEQVRIGKFQSAVVKWLNQTYGLNLKTDQLSRQILKRYDVDYHILKHEVNFSEADESLEIGDARRKPGVGMGGFRGLVAQATTKSTPSPEEKMIDELYHKMVEPLKEQHTPEVATMLDARDTERERQFQLSRFDDHFEQISQLTSPFDTERLANKKMQDLVWHKKSDWRFFSDASKYSAKDLCVSLKDHLGEIIKHSETERAQLKREAMSILSHNPDPLPENERRNLNKKIDGMLAYDKLIETAKDAMKPEEMTTPVLAEVPKPVPTEVPKPVVETLKRLGIEDMDTKPYNSDQLMDVRAQLYKEMGDLIARKKRAREPLLGALNAQMNVLEQVHTKVFSKIMDSYVLQVNSKNIDQFRQYLTSIVEGLQTSLKEASTGPNRDLIKTISTEIELANAALKAMEEKVKKPTA